MREAQLSPREVAADGVGSWPQLLDEVAGGHEVVVTTAAGRRVVVVAEERLLALRAATPGSPRALTDRELEVLRCVAEGATGGAVARHLGLAANTVAQHLVSVRRKLGTSTTAAAIAVARDTGLLPAARG